MTTGAHGVSLPVGERGRQEFLHQWLSQERTEALSPLWCEADRTRVEFVGRQTNLWGTIRLSNHCDQECGFCGLRGESDIPRYRLSADEVMSAARNAAAKDCSLVVLQSGRDAGMGADAIADLVRRILGETGLPVALSLGERSDAEYAAWRRAGAERYFLRFVTSNTLLYRFLHGSACGDPRRRLPLLTALKQLGYRVGSGIFVGFPGQSLASLACDLEFMCNLDLDDVLVGPYVWPAELAPNRAVVQEGDANSAKAVMKAIALARLLCPNADIPSTGALATVGGPGVHAAALRRGANALAVDFTAAGRLADYRCYPGRSAMHESSWTDAASLRETLEQDGDAATESQPRAGAATAAPGRPTVQVCLCMGSSCFSRGNNRTAAAIREFIASQRLGDRVVFEGHLCQGRCKSGPNVAIDGEALQHADAVAVIEHLKRRLKLKE